MSDEDEEDVESCPSAVSSVSPAVSSMSPTSTKLSNQLSKKGFERPLPDPFPLPENFRYDVEVALKSGKMSRETSKSFLSAVASSMLSYKRYPSRDEYVMVAMTIINKYPFMKSPSGSPTVSYIMYYLCTVLFFPNMK